MTKTHKQQKLHGPHDFAPLETVLGGSVYGQEMHLDHKFRTCMDHQCYDLELATRQVKVLSTLIHELHDFASLNSNPKNI